MKKLNVLLLTLLVLLLVGYFYHPAPPAPAPVQQTQVLGKMTKLADCKEVNGKPDHACTPGETDPRVTQDNISSTICVSGYSASVRPSSSVTNKIKVERMAAYGYSDAMGNYELDHLISLELGGCPDCVTNLWPEPYSGTLGARAKDKVENYLHKQVCAGAMSLIDAQTIIAGDWESVYNTLPSN